MLGIHLETWTDAGVFFLAIIGAGNVVAWVVTIPERQRARKAAEVERAKRDERMEKLLQTAEDTALRIFGPDGIDQLDDDVLAEAVRRGLARKLARMEAAGPAEVDTASA